MANNRIHVNLETGEPGVCKALVNCPFGDLELDHFDSKEEARAAYEKLMENETFEAKVIAQKKVIGAARVSGFSDFDNSRKSILPAGTHGGYFAPDTVVKAAHNLIDQMPELTPLKNTVKQASERAEYVSLFQRNKEIKAQRNLALAIDKMTKPAEGHIAVRTVDALAAARASSFTPKDKLKDFVGSRALAPSAQALQVVKALREQKPISFGASGFVKNDPLLSRKAS